MTHDGTSQSGVEAIRLAIGRAGFTALMAGLMLGVSLFLIGQKQSSKTVLALTIGLMLVLPLVNVAAGLAGGGGRRDWG